MSSLAFDSIDGPHTNGTLTAINLEGLEKPKNSFTIWDFSDPDSVKACVDMSDQDIGGSSNASFVHVPASSSEPAHAHFSGHISNELPKDDDNVQRTGYAAWRTEPRPATMFGKSLWDVEHYKYLGIRLKSDSRKYKVNVQTESVEYTDLHQHRLYVRHPGQWETVLIRWEDFVRTNHGIIVEPQSEMLRNQVRTIGVGLTDRLPGAFDFRISNIWATNGPEPTDGVEYENPERRFIPRELKMPVGAVPKQVGFEAKKGA